MIHRRHILTEDFLVLWWSSGPSFMMFSEPWVQALCLRCINLRWAPQSQTLGPLCLVVAFYKYFSDAKMTIL